MKQRILAALLCVLLLGCSACSTGKKPVPPRYTRTDAATEATEASNTTAPETAAPSTAPEDAYQPGRLYDDHWTSSYLKLAFFLPDYWTMTAPDKMERYNEFHQDQSDGMIEEMQAYYDKTNGPMVTVTAYDLSICYPDMELDDITWSYRELLKSSYANIASIDGVNLTYHVGPAYDYDFKNETYQLIRSYTERTDSPGRITRFDRWDLLRIAGDHVVCITLSKNANDTLYQVDVEYLLNYFTIPY